MAYADVEQLLSEYKSLKGQRYNWENHWQDIADVMLTNRAEFTDVHVRGDRRRDHLYDNTPALALRQLASSLHGMLKPESSQWFDLRTKDPELMMNNDVKFWLSDCARILRGAINSKKSKFIQASGEVDQDLCAFGTGCLFIGERSDKSGLLFRSYHLNDVFINVNADGDIDTIYLRSKLTARQAIQRHGEKSVSANLIRHRENKDGDQEKTFEFVEIIKPRDEMDPPPKMKDMKFGSCVVEVEEKHKIEKNGYYEFPFAIPRWDTSAGELYGRGPGSFALPDSNTLQAMGETLLTAGQKIVDPPLFAASDSMIGQMNTFPGGISYFDAESLLGSPSGRPVFPLETGANLPLGREMQGDVRYNVAKAFYADQLELPTDGPQMTATEVYARRQQFIQNLGPVFSRLEADYTAVIVERCFNILARAGAFPPPPDVIGDRDIDFMYSSPTARARMQSDLAGFTSAFELLAPLLQIQPEAADYVNADAIIKDLPEAFGHRPQYLKTPEEVAQIRQTRAEQQQQQTLLDAAPGAAQAITALDKLGGG